MFLVRLFPCFPGRALLFPHCSSCFSCSSWTSGSSSWTSCCSVSFFLVGTGTAALAAAGGAAVATVDAVATRLAVVRAPAAPGLGPHTAGDRRVQRAGGGRRAGEGRDANLAPLLAPVLLLGSRDRAALVPSAPAGTLAENFHPVSQAQHRMELFVGVNGPLLDCRAIESPCAPDAQGKELATVEILLVLCFEQLQLLRCLRGHVARGEIVEARHEAAAILDRHARESWDGPTPQVPGQLCALDAAGSAPPSPCLGNTLPARKENGQTKGATMT